MQKKLPLCANLNNLIKTITYKLKNIMKQNLLNKLWLRVCMIVAVMTTALAGTAWAQSTSTLTFEAKCNGSGTADDGVEWTVTSDGTESVFDNTKGIHYGTNSGKVQYITLSTSDISGTITKVVVNASTASGVTATVGVTVGGDAFGGDPQSLTANAANYTFEGSAEGEIVVTVTKPSQATKAIYVKSVAVTYTAGGGSSGPTEDNDLALTGAPIALNFDLYNNATAQTIHYTTSSTGEVSVEAGMYDVSCYVDNDAKTISVTPMFATNGPQTVTVNQAADDTYKAGSVTFTVTVTDSTPIPTHTATFSVNGATTTQEFEEGADIVFPANPADVSGKTFVGWATTAINGTTNEAPTFVKNATMGDSDVTYYAVFAYASGSGSAEVTDVLTRESTGVTGTSYSDWSDVTATSAAVYAGQSAGGNDAIQLRSNNNNSGIVTTTSGGKVTKVTITWNSNTSDGRTVNVYGSDVAYSAATELYGSSQGTLLGTIVCGTSTELDITDDYEYVGLRSASSALWLDKVEITWSTGGGVSYSDYCTTVVAAAVERPVITVAENPFTFSTTATITCETAGASILYGYNGEDWQSYDGGIINITETTTIYAKAIKDSKESSVASVTVTKVLAEPTITIDATGITNTDLYVGTDAGSLSAAVTYNDAAVEGATITWSGDNDAVATIDATTGVVTLVAAGSVTFTATYAGNANYSEKTATYEMTVTNSDPNVPGTENNPYTVAQAIAFIETLGSATSATEVYVSGIISQVDSYNSTYSSIQYWISDDGTTTGQMEVYSGKGLNGADFSSVDDLQVGDVVTVKGYVKMYKGTPEFDKNNELVSLDRPVVTTPYIEVSTTTVEATAAGLDGTIDVTYNNLTDVLAEVQFVEADGTTPATYAWVFADIDANNNVEYLIEENTSADARTAYLKVYAIGNEGEAYSDLITITQAGVVVDYAVVPFVYDGGKGSLPTGFTESGLGSDYKSKPYLKFDNTGDYLIVKIDKEAAMLFFDIKGNSFSGGTFTVQTSADGTTYTDLQAYTDLGDTQTESFTLSSDVRYIKWIYTNKSSGNVGLGNIKVVDWVETVTVGTAGYATYVTEHNSSFPAGVTAYIGAVNGQYLTLTEVASAPKGTPVVLKGDEGTYTLIPTVADELADVSSNELKASETDVVANGTQYVLAKPAGKEVGFYKAETGSTIAAGKAYLEITSSVKAFYFSFDDDPTGLSDMSDKSDQSDIIFNLAGQRISKMQRGINIVGGKKIAIK